MIKTNIKQLPLSERPYEKCLKYGVSSLSDAELLAVIIRTGTKKENSIQLASRVINEIPGKKISGLFQMSVAQLVDIHGIGNAKAVQLLSLTEITKRMCLLHWLRQISYVMSLKRRHFVLCRKCVLRKLNR